MERDERMKFVSARPAGTRVSAMNKVGLSPIRSFVAAPKWFAAAKLGLIFLLLGLAYAVGAATWNESVDAFTAGDLNDHRGLLIGGFGGALMVALLGAAWAVAARAMPK
jgi:hypothetical protein